LAHAVGEVDVEVAAFKMDFFGVGLESFERGAGFGGGLGGEECDDDLAGVQVAAGWKRSRGNGLAEVGGGAEHDFGAESVGAFDGGLDFCGQLGEILFFGAEDYVAALQMGADVFQFERDVEGAEGVHFNQVAAADVYAAEQGDHYGHGEQYKLRTAFCSPGRSFTRKDPKVHEGKPRNRKCPFDFGRTKRDTLRRAGVL
jgi:hypothetical protein